MKVLIALLFSICLYSQKYTVVQINAHWNETNKVKLPKEINGAKVLYAYLEDQVESLKKEIKVVPTILVYKDNTPIAQFEAGIDLKLHIKEADILEVINNEVL
jgi:hypothetical protein